MKVFILLLSLVLSTHLLFASGPPKRTPLKIGDKAPKITQNDVFGELFSLRKSVRESKLLVVFMRHAWCPVCNARTHELIKNYDALKEQGYEVVAVYQTVNESLELYAQDYNIPFKLLADPDSKLYYLYQLEFSKTKVAKSTLRKRFDRIYKKGKKDFQGKDPKRYKVKGEGGLSLIPGDFVINKKGMLEQAYYGKFLGDHLPLELLLGKEEE
jgi:peroxiredoxin Q/BCP